MAFLVLELPGAVETLERLTLLLEADDKVAEIYILTHNSCAEAGQPRKHQLL
jgi:hypothetical protein